MVVQVNVERQLRPHALQARQAAGVAAAVKVIDELTHLVVASFFFLSFFFLRV